MSRMVECLGSMMIKMTSDSVMMNLKVGEVTKSMTMKRITEF